MNLTIDEGNSCIKAGVFEGDKLIADMLFDYGESAAGLQQLFDNYPIKNTILSSVIHTAPDVKRLLNEKSQRFVELNEQTPIPIKNCYKTPATLGKDRLAVAIAANYLKPNSDNLVIDAGSCITYDFVNAQGEYLGGNISPGMRMRFNALHTFTQKLPLVEPTNEFFLLGDDTQSAILNGVINGICFEIDGYIKILQETSPELSTFLTGGDTFFFETTLKSSIFACKNLLLIGLNRILNYNV